MATEQDHLKENGLDLTACAGYSIRTFEPWLSHFFTHGLEFEEMLFGDQLSYRDESNRPYSLRMVEPLTHATDQYKVWLMEELSKRSPEDQQTFLQATYQDLYRQKRTTIESFFEQSDKHGAIVIENATVAEALRSDEELKNMDLLHIDSRADESYDGSTFYVDRGAWGTRVVEHDDGTKRLIMLRTTEPHYEVSQARRATIADISLLYERNPHIVYQLTYDYHHVELVARLVENVIADRFIHEVNPEEIAPFLDMLARSGNMRHELEMIERITRRALHVVDYRYDDYFTEVLSVGKSGQSFKLVPDHETYISLGYTYRRHIENCPGATKDSREMVRRMIAAHNYLQEFLKEIGQDSYSRKKFEHTEDLSPVLYDPKSFTNQANDSYIDWVDRKIATLEYIPTGEHDDEKIARLQGERAKAEERKKVMDKFLGTARISRPAAEAVCDMAGRDRNEQTLLFNLMHLAKTEGMDLQSPGLTYLIQKVILISDESWRHFLTLHEMN